MSCGVNNRVAPTTTCECTDVHVVAIDKFKSTIGLLGIRITNPDIGLVTGRNVLDLSYFSTSDSAHHKQNQQGMMVGSWAR